MSMPAEVPEEENPAPLTEEGPDGQIVSTGGPRAALLTQNQRLAEENARLKAALAQQQQQQQQEQQQQESAAVPGLLLSTDLPPRGDSCPLSPIPVEQLETLYAADLALENAYQVREILRPCLPLPQSPPD